MKHKVLMGIGVLLLIVGYLVYPHIQQRRFDTWTAMNIAIFQENIEVYREAHRQRFSREDSQFNTPEEDPHFWLNFVGQGLAIANFRLNVEDQRHLLDPFSYNHPSFSLQPFGFDSAIIGILNISAIDLSVPIYLGASAEHLNQGVAHLTHSSFPIGGDNTNAVLAGHRNTTYARVFRHLYRLELGDEIQIINFLETIIYVVVEVGIADATDRSPLVIQPGRDLVTLMTTARWRDSGRYVVIAERVN